MTPEQYSDLWRLKHQMNTEQQQQLEKIKLARQNGVLPWSHLSVQKLAQENVIDFLLSIV